MRISSRRARRLATLGTAIAVMTGFIACGGGDGGTAPVVDNTPASVVLSPSTPATVTSGATLTLSASVRAKDGHTVAAAVSWTSSDATVASVTGGLVTGAKIGVATITATAGAASANVAITVVAGAATQLALRTQPAGAVIGNALSAQPVVEVRDVAGNLVASSTASITATIASGGGALGGTPTVTASGGVATFAGLSISGFAGDRTITFASTGLQSVTSAAFTMQPPPFPVIVIDSSAVIVSTQHAVAPPAVTLHVTNGGGVPLTTLAVGTVAYDAGQTTGWLSASLSSASAPSSLTLTFLVSTLANGRYHATLPIVAPGANNTPQTVSVTLVVFAGSVVSYGTSAEKVRVLDVGASFLPATSTVDSAGQAITGPPVTYASRATSVATVDADGRITAKLAGEAWVVATTSASTDSIYIIVPRSTVSPILRTTNTTWLARAGDTTVVTIVLDTRGTTIGAGSFAIGIQTTPSVWSSITYVAATGAVVTNSTGDILRASVGAANGLNGQIALVTIKLLGRNANLSGWLTLFALDVAAVDGSDLTASVTSTRFPISIR